MTVERLRANWLSALLIAVGVAIVTAVLVWQLATAYIEVWVFVAGIISVVCWMLLGERSTWQPARSIAVPIALAMIAAGAIGSAPSNGLVIVPTAIGLLRLLSESRNPIWIGITAALAAVALVALGSLTVSVSVLGLLSLGGGGPTRPARRYQSSAVAHRRRASARITGAYDAGTRGARTTVGAGGTAGACT